MSGSEVGWSLAVGHRGEVVHTVCTGPHTPATRFDIASTSKQFTGLAALLTLDLNDETWRLLHHRSGLPDYIDLLKAAGYGYRDVTTTVDALAVLDGAPLDFEPGTAWAYSNTNYFVLGQRVEAATGESSGRGSAGPRVRSPRPGHGHGPPGSAPRQRHVVRCQRQPGGLTVGAGRGRRDVVQAVRARALGGLVLDGPVRRGRPRPAADHGRDHRRGRRPWRRRHLRVRGQRPPDALPPRRLERLRDVLHPRPRGPCRRRPLHQPAWPGRPRAEPGHPPGSGATASPDPSGWTVRDSSRGRRGGPGSGGSASGGRAHR